MKLTRYKMIVTASVALFLASAAAHTEPLKIRTSYVVPDQLGTADRCQERPSNALGFQLRDGG